MQQPTTTAGGGPMGGGDGGGYGADIERACAVLRRGGVVLYPTDTVWGLGCDAADSAAVERVFRIKHRADSKALILLVADGDMLRAHAAPLCEAAERLLREPGERPLTLVVDGGRGLAPEVMAADGSVGMRIPREAFAQGLCRAFGRPLVSTSANVSGEPPAGRFADIDPAIVAAVDYCCTSRRDEPAASAPSRVVKVGCDGSITVIRP